MGSMQLKTKGAVGFQVHSV